MTGRRDERGHNPSPKQLLQDLHDRAAAKIGGTPTPAACVEGLVRYLFQDFLAWATVFYGALLARKWGVNNLGIQDADDLAQELCTKVWNICERKPYSLPDDDASGWLYRVAERIAIDALRSGGGLAGSTDQVGNDTSEPPAPGPGPEDEAVGNELLEKVRAALDPRLLKVVELQMAEYSSGEIAVKLGYRPGDRSGTRQVERLRERARKRLKGIL